MKNDNIIQVKSYSFALWVVKLYKYLCDEKKEFVLSKQLLRSGTSVGANVEEALGGHRIEILYQSLVLLIKKLGRASIGFDY